MALVTSKTKAEHDRQHMEKQAGKKSSYDEPDYDKMSGDAKELVLHADNDEHLYKSSHIPIVKNLQKKMAKGQYDQQKARKLWGYHSDRAAQSYHKEHGSHDSKWHEMFDVPTRKEAAHHFESMHREQVEDPTNFSNKE
jgi:hypothetical protein